LLRIEQGKGRKDLFVMLSQRLLQLLRDLYRIGHSFATHMLEQNIDIRVVQVPLGTPSQRPPPSTRGWPGTPFTPW
jgi:integrase